MEDSKTAKPPEKYESRAFSKKINSLMSASRNEEIISILKETNLRNWSDFTGNTLLHVAVQNDNEAMTQYFIQAGWKVDAQNIYGKTPLIVSIENYCTQAYEVLLDANATIFLHDYAGRSALHWFLDTRHCFDSHHVRKLLHMFKKQCSNDIQLIATRLRDAGWPVVRALSIDNIQVLKAMLDNGCEVDARESRCSRTALHEAVSSNDVELVKLLLSYGADPNALDRYHEAPLDYVYMENLRTFFDHTDERFEIVKMLVAEGAKLSLGERPDSWNIARILRYGTGEVIELLLRDHIDLSADILNGTALHMLAKNRDPGIIQPLGDRIFDVEARNSNLDTPLFVAASFANVHTVEFLLKRGAHVNAVNSDGITPLYRCIERFCPAIHEYQTDVNTNSSDVAREFGRCVKLLLEHGASLQLEGNEGERRRTVFDIKYHNKNCEMRCMGKLLLVHLILREASGMPVDESIHRKISKHEILKGHHDFLMRLVKTKIHQSVTILELITESNIRFERRLRYKELVSRMQEYFDESNLNDYLIGMLKNRFSKTLERIELRKEAAYQLRQLVPIIDSLIADKIVDYLCEPDVQCLSQVSL